MKKGETLRLDAEFIRMAESLKKQEAERVVKRLDRLTEEQLESLAHFWVRQVLLSDEHRRSQGLDDDEFDEIGSQLQQQRTELGQMLAKGRFEKMLPAMHSFIHLCGLDVEISPEESKRAGSVFLRALVTGLDHQLQRQRGEVVQTDKVAAPAPTPKEAAAAQSEADAQAITWDDAFASWRDYVPGRNKGTTIATQTPWLELKRLARRRA